MSEDDAKRREIQTDDGWGRDSRENLVKRGDEQDTNRKSQNFVDEKKDVVDNLVKSLSEARISDMERSTRLICTVKSEDFKLMNIREAFKEYSNVNGGFWLKQIDEGFEIIFEDAETCRKAHDSLRNNSNFTLSFKYPQETPDVSEQPGKSPEKRQRFVEADKPPSQPVGTPSKDVRPRFAPHTRDPNRPVTTDLVAFRLIANSLGMKVKRDEEKVAQEKKKLEDARQARKT